MSRPETAIQRELRAHLDKLGIYSVHVPNGAVLGGNSKQRAIQMQALKKDGLRVGFPDLILYRHDGDIAHVEVKAGSGKQSDSQLECQEWLEQLGHKYAVCRSVEGLDAALKQWGWA